MCVLGERVERGEMTSGILGVERGAKGMKLDLVCAVGWLDEVV